MIQVGTILHVADNTGARKVQCIKVFGQKTASIGDIILVSVKSVASSNQASLRDTGGKKGGPTGTAAAKGGPARKAKKGEISRALVIRTKFGQVRKDGSAIKFGQNAVILLTVAGGVASGTSTPSTAPGGSGAGAQGTPKIRSVQPKGTRVFGPLTRDLDRVSLKDAAREANSGQCVVRTPKPALKADMKILFLADRIV